MSRERFEDVGNLQEYIFENIANYAQLDPSIVQGIIRCVSSSGMRTTEEDILNHIQGDVITIYRDDQSGEVFAFSSTAFGTPNELLGSSEISDTYGCYLVGATVSKDKQGMGLYKKMNERRIGFAVDRQLPLVFTRTQNPRVQSAMQGVLDGMREEGRIAGYTLERILVPGHYGKMLTQEKPQDDKLSFDELDYERGDAYLLLFSLEYGSSSEFQQEPETV